MKISQELAQRAGIIWRVSYEVVVIRENGPSLKLPFVSMGKVHERFAEQVETFSRAEDVPFVERTCGNHECAGRRQPVNRCMWPVSHVASVACD